VVPRHYELELVPDLTAASFSGSVAIDVEFTEPTQEFLCHAAELDIHSARLVVGETTTDIEFDLDESSEQIRFRTADPVPTGKGRVELMFTGILNDKLRGFYRSTYADDSGTEHTIATTQFQSTDARRAFPCWDEPAFKATFTVTLVVSPELLAIANTSELDREVLDDGRHRVSFATTMLMSTYLVAFVVGPLEVTQPVDVDGVPVRVVHRPGRGDQTAFALDVAAHAMRWLTDYYDIPYPSDKVDLVAIPDFAAGAMENLGCITFREVLVLVDPATASQPELQHVADVVNHELAHMWFGDLVTMRWWEGIWLNEAFATFMETACSDAYRPDWDVWTTFGRSRSVAHNVDALASTRAIEYPVISADDADDMFDIITYEKGASVVRMLERYLGTEAFRDGVRHYLKRHAYGNTETTDLWDSIEEVSGEPVRSLMDDWIFQGGHPVITARADEHGLVVEQQHFTLDAAAADDRRWAVPMRIRTEADGGSTEHKILLDRQRRVYTGVVGDLVTANVDGAGFYRVVPDAAMLEHLRRHGPSRMATRERHSLVDDMWALTLTGRMDASTYFEIVTSGFAGEDDVTVWQALSAGIGGLRYLIDGVALERFAEAIDRLCGPVMARLGPEGDDAEDDRTRELRATILRLRGAIADLPDAVDEARGLLESTDATLAAAALNVAARHGSNDDFERFRDRFRAARDAQTEQRHLHALADFPDTALVMSIVEETRGGEVRSQDGPYLIRRALTNRHAGTLVWAFVTDHWEQLNEAFPSNSIVRMLEGIVALDDPDRASSVSSFLDGHPVPQGHKQLEQHLERLSVNVALRAREANRFAASLVADRPSPDPSRPHHSAPIR
jgi:puromycin-sensitive aminopeptidase